jgi:hypothetical protein
MDRGPIFVAGLERSGTSLLYALLSSHPDIAMSRRTNLWTYFYNQYGDLSRPENFERCLGMMMKYNRVLKLEPDPERIRREFRQGEPTYARLFALLEEHHAEKQNKRRWGDKSLNTERYADPIFAAYPDARILHILRDPRDRYASALTRWKVSRGGVGAGTAMWMSSVALARRNHALYPDRYLVIRYETLTAKPEETVRALCDFIGEEFSPQMFSMQSSGTFLQEGSNSSYGQNDPGKIFTSSIGRYQKVLNIRQISFMQQFAGQEMVRLDYPLQPIRLAPGEQARYLVVDLPFNLARMAAWRAREAYLNRKGRTVPSYRIVEGPGALAST